jgi:predicted RNA-binding protein with PIN domain
MTTDFPDKDVQVAFRLLEKLTLSREELVQARNAYEVVSDSCEKHRSLISTRTGYLDILEEVAEAIGETVEPENNTELVGLENQLSEAKTRFDAASKELQRLRMLAEKLRSQAPKLWSLAEDRFGQPVELYYEATDSAVDSVEKNESESDDESEVNVVDRILNWKPDAAEATAQQPERKTVDSFELARNFNTGLLQGARFQNRMVDARLTIVFDAPNIIETVKRYEVDESGGIEGARRKLVNDIGALCAEMKFYSVVVFDTPYTHEGPYIQDLEVQFANRKSPDKPASNRQILRTIEEHHLEKKPVALVTDDLTLSRDAATIGAIIIDNDELFRGIAQSG